MQYTQEPDYTHTQATFIKSSKVQKSLTFLICKRAENPRLSRLKCYMNN